MDYACLRQLSATVKYFPLRNNFVLDFYFILWVEIFSFYFVSLLEVISILVSVLVNANVEIPVSVLSFSKRIYH